MSTDLSLAMSIFIVLTPLDIRPWAHSGPAWTSLAFSPQDASRQVPSGQSQHANMVGLEPSESQALIFELANSKDQGLGFIPIL